MAKVKAQPQEAQRYLVVVKPPPLKAGQPSLGQQLQGQISQGAWAQKRPITCKTVTAETAEGAAEAVGVPAGATAHVVPMEHVQTFKRPEHAPLEAA